MRSIHSRQDRLLKQTDASKPSIQFDKSHPCYVEFQQCGDNRGHLVVLEEGKEIPFPIKRVFYIYGSESKTIRGQHANKNSEFVLVNVAGTSKIKTIDTDGVEAVFELNHPYRGVYLPNMIWKEMYDFSHDSVLLVLVSAPYDGNEYIRDFQEYLKESTPELRN